MSNWTVHQKVIQISQILVKGPERAVGDSFKSPKYELTFIQQITSSYYIRCIVSSCKETEPGRGQSGSCRNGYFTDPIPRYTVYDIDIRYSIERCGP